MFPIILNWFLLIKGEFQTVLKLIQLLHFFSVYSFFHHMKKVLSKHYLFRLGTLYIHVLIHVVKLQQKNIKKLYSNFQAHLY